MGDYNLNYLTEDENNELEHLRNVGKQFREMAEQDEKIIGITESVSESQISIKMEIKVSVEIMAIMKILIK